MHDRIRDEATDDWDDRVAVDRLEAAGARFVRGDARLTGRARSRSAARPSRPRAGWSSTPAPAGAPPIDGLADTPYWTNRDVLRIETLPGSLTVIGGGPIGAELAQALSRFGVRVTLLERRPDPRPGSPRPARWSRRCSPARASRCSPACRSLGVLRRRPLHVALDDQDLDAEKLLVAAGRAPTWSDLGLDTVGLDPAARPSRSTTGCVPARGSGPSAT